MFGGETLEQSCSSHRVLLRSIKLASTGVAQKGVQVTTGVLDSL